MPQTPPSPAGEAALYPPPDRSELACALAMAPMLVLFLLAAPVLLLARCWHAPFTRWLRYQVRRTAEDFYQDRHELAAYLFVLAFFAFVIFLYPFQP